MLSEITFTIDKNFDLATALKGFPVDGIWENKPHENIESKYFDTFDWRLHNDSLYLVQYNIT